MAIEVAGRLIRQEQDRMMDECPRDGDRWRFATGKLGGPMLEPMRQLDPVQQLAGPFLRLGTARAADQRRDQHVLQHRALRQQVVFLKDEADMAVAKIASCFSSRLERILAVERDLARRGRVERAQNVQRHLLPEPDGPMTGEGLAGLEREAELATAR